MGSPFNICELRIAGDWIPDLPETDWQDLCVRREDDSAIALVRWETPGNQPGFRIYVIDVSSERTFTSERFLGCCEDLSWDGPSRIAFSAFPDLHGAFDLPQDEVPGE